MDNYLLGLVVDIDEGLARGVLFGAFDASEGRRSPMTVDVHLVQKGKLFRGRVAVGLLDGVEEGALLLVEGARAGQDGVFGAAGRRSGIVVSHDVWNIWGN